MRQAITILAVLVLATNIFALEVGANTIDVAPAEVLIDDNDLCSLREAIENANDTTDGDVHDDCSAGDPAGLDTIELANSSTYTLPDAPAAFDADGFNALPSITSSILINGNGAVIERDSILSCTINGTTEAGEFRIFHVANLTHRLTLNHVTIQNGCADGSSPERNGGGLFLLEGTVLIDNSRFTGNTALNGGGVAIESDGTLTINESTFDQNSVAFGGNGGGLYSEGRLLIESSTFASNTGSGAGAAGAAMFINPPTTTLLTTIRNSTIAGNLGAFAAVVNHQRIVNIDNSTIVGNTIGMSDFFGGIYNVKNSIVANNIVQDCRSATFITINATGDNFDTDGTCEAEDADFTEVTPAQINLDMLQNNGGPTETVALLTGSVAIDAALDCTDLNSDLVDFDQRGTERPQSAECDVGAFEFINPADLEVVKSNDTASLGVTGTSFNWTLSITNTGPGDAHFPDGEVILRDELSTGATYGNPVLDNLVGVTGSIICAVDGNPNLVCSADGDVVIAMTTGAFDVVLPTTPDIPTGLLVNPRAGGLCQVDPDNNVVEDDESNNDCNADSVTIDSPLVKLAAPTTVNVTRQFNIPFWCGERKEQFTMNGDEFTNLEQFQTEIEVIFPQKRILLVFPGPQSIAQLVQTATLTEPSNFQTPGAMTIPIRSTLLSGKTSRFSCSSLNALPTRLDASGNIDEFLYDVIANADVVHGVFTLESDQRDLKVFVTKIVRSWKCVDEGAGLTCAEGNLTRMRTEIGSGNISIRRTITHEIAQPVVAADYIAGDVKQFPRFEARTFGIGRAMGFMAHHEQVDSVGIEIYALNGNQIFSHRESGHRLTWRMNDSQERLVANGVYLYILTAHDIHGNVVRSNVKKLLVMR